MRDDGRWKAGLAFEDHIAECYRRKGWVVFHRGRERGGADLGIDIVAVKRNRYVLIQCKRWAEGREIPLATIELFHRDGEAYKKRRAHGQPSLAFWDPPSYLLVFAATCAFAEDARAWASARGIICRERVQFPPVEIQFATAASTQAPERRKAPLPASPARIKFDAPEPVFKRAVRKTASVFVTFALGLVFICIPEIGGAVGRALGSLGKATGLIWLPWILVAGLVWASLR